MLKLSEIVSLPLINLYELKIEGYIEKVYINSERKRLELLLVYNESNDSYYLVKYNDIYRIGTNAVFITNSSKITLYENLESIVNSCVNPANAIIYTINGEYVGKTSEILFKDGYINSIVSNEKSYESNLICGISNELIIIASKKFNLKRFKQKTTSFIMPKQLPYNNESEQIVTILQTNKVAPHREIINYKFLINRTILKDIKSHTGEVIANKNTLVTQQTLNKLKYYGKLKELMLNSK